MPDRLTTEALQEIDAALAEHERYLAWCRGADTWLGTVPDRPRHGRTLWDWLSALRAEVEAQREELKSAHDVLSQLHASLCPMLEYVPDVRTPAPGDQPSVADLLLADGPGTVPPLHLLRHPRRWLPGVGDAQDGRGQVTREQRTWIDDLLDWLDNNADGADDAGALAHNCTNWHPALKALKDEQAAREDAAVKWALQYSIDHTAFNPDLAVVAWRKTGGAR